MARLKLKAAVVAVALAFAMPAHAGPVIVAVAAAVAGPAIAAGLGFVVGTLQFAAVAAVAAVGTSMVLGGILNKPERQSSTGSGGAQGYVAEMRDRLHVVRSAVETRRIVYGQQMVSGPLVYAEVTGASKEYLHLVIPLAGHESEEIGDVYFDDTLVGSLDGSGNVTSGRYSGYARVKKHLGTAAQTADSDLVAESGGQWTTNHRLRGITYIYVRLQWAQDIFPKGIPNIKALVKGKKLIDPRLGSPTTSAWSDNWALVMRDYLTATYGLGCDDSEIDDTAIIAAANICDEQVALNADSPTSYQSRYTCNGTVNTADRPVDVIRALATAAAGAAVFTQGVWKVYAGAYVTPEHDIDESWLRGPVKVNPRKPRRDLYNMVRGTFSDADKFYQPTDFPPVRNATYVTQDGGEEIPRDIVLPFTTNNIRAQRIAKIHLEKSRQAITVELPCNLKAFPVAVWDTVRLSIDLLGWSSKVFQVLGWTFNPSGGVDLQLQEEASTVYDWAFGDATEIDSAPDTDLPDVFTVEPPGLPLVTETVYETREGRGVAAKAVITCTASTHAFVQFYQFEYRENGTSTWTVLPLKTDPVAEIDDIAPGRYDFRAKAINTFGVSSTYATTSDKEIQGLAARPATPSGVSVQVAGGTAIITLTQQSELDVLRGGRILVRHTEATSAQSWDESLSIGKQEGYPGDSVVIFLPLKAGTYLLKAQDSSGQESESFATAVTKQASVLAFTSAATPLQEDTTFPGTHSGTVISGSALLLEATGGSPPGPVRSSGTYTFSAGFDFGSVKRVRITGQLEGVVFNANDLIDARTDAIDSWVDFDGTSGIGSLADAWLECRETDDSPGSPVPSWSEWKRIDAAEFECQAMEFRLQMRSFDSTYNIQIDILRVNAKEVL